MSIEENQCLSSQTKKNPLFVLRLYFDVPGSFSLMNFLPKIFN